MGSSPTFPANAFSLVTLAQSARAPGSELGGCGFEPRTSPQVFSRRVAQLAERCPDTAEVNGSIPFAPTTSSMPLHMIATIPVGQSACRKRGKQSIPLLGTNAHCVRSLADSGNRLLSGRTKARRRTTVQPIRKRIGVRADDDTLSVVVKTPHSPFRTHQVRFQCRDSSAGRASAS